MSPAPGVDRRNRLRRSALRDRGAMKHAVYAPGAQMLRHTDEHGDPLHHWCYPLADPRWVSAREALHMRPDDPVIGLEFDGGSWALPWWIMKNHHVANLVLNGRAALVALCEVCSSAAAFDPVIEGRRHTFRLEGLYNGTIMLKDYETGSLWSGVTGAAFEGAMEGRVMERLPALQSTWAEWMELRPDTLVPDGEGESREGHGAGHVPGSPMVGPDMRGMLQHADLRLPHYELVLGVLAGAAARCYPLAALAGAGRVLNDTLGGEDIAVFWRPGTWMASAYRRQLDGRTLTFRSEGESVVDEETGSRWEISGVAGSGPLQGRQLRYVHSGVEEFYIWAAFHPETEIYGHAADAGAAADRDGWTGSAYPAPVRQAIRSRWWPRDTKLLAVGCGDGMIAAWLAEMGLKVVGVDPEPGNIERARTCFRGLRRLRFRVADLRRPVAFDRRFDAVLDHGYLHRLDPGARAAYAANIAAAAAPGARFLLLMPVPPEQLRERIRNVRQLFESTFELVKARSVPLPAEAGEGTPSGVAFRLVRRP
ncbi:MAG: DUF3179 domain-containing protein [Betaproteobacteria bacterium]|nr:DUF3179 domain-containing protein [Betaproteobacteria bacterium]